MPVSSRAKSLSAGLAFLLSSTMLAGIAHADIAADAAADADASSEMTEIVVVGSGHTRSVSTLLPSDLDVLPPGSSVQKALNVLPGVSAQSIDALGVNEQSLSLQVRGFSTTHLGYTLDGMPLGDGAYNNYNGLTISRALISENLARAELATGIAGLSIPSTSNLGGALSYTSSNPHADRGLSLSQGFGSEDSRRTFMRVDTGDYNGFSAYLSGQYTEQDLFIDQPAGNKSFGKQLNGKAQYRFARGVLTAFADVSRTNQADDPYLSKDMQSRLGWDWGGVAPDWDTYLGLSYCVLQPKDTPDPRCVPSTGKDKSGEAAYTNGQILRNDELYYIAGDFDLSASLSARVQVYKHTDKGAGNNFINTGWSTQGTVDTSDDVPVQVRDTRYSIDRSGALGSLSWESGIHHVQAGFWFEENTSSAVRYFWTNVTGPFSLAHYLKGQPDTTEWAQETDWKTRQFYVQDTLSLLDDTLSIDFGFKSTNAKSTARAIDGIAKAPPGAKQFASGSLTARDNFLPEVGVRWQVAPGHELFASYAENIAMYQGGFKLGPQSVTQTIWDLQGQYLKPETSKSVDVGYRYVSQPLQVSVALYDVKFDNRLLQYNPCPTKDQSQPNCGNSFHNAGSITSKGLEVGVLWKPLTWLNWYNSASYNETTYDDNLDWCDTNSVCSVKLTKGKQQVDTPKEMFSSVLNLHKNGFWGSLSGKYTGERFYTYTNDQGFGGVTTFDLGFGYDFTPTGVLKGAKLAVNVTNLTDKRYASNFDNSAFVPDDATGKTLIFHASAPRQVFVTLGLDF